MKKPTVIRGCKQKKRTNKQRHILIDRLHTVEVQEGGWTRFVCRTCGRVSFELRYTPSYEAPPPVDESETPQWLVEMRKKVKSGEVKLDKVNHP